MYSAPSVDKWRALASTSLGHLINDGWSMFIPLMADIIVNEKQTPLVVVTLITISFYSSSALLNFYIGHLADRRGRQGTVMATGIALISLAFLGFALALSLPRDSLLYFFVAAMAILAGMGSACYHPIAGAIIQTSFGPGDSGKALGLNGAFGQVGAALFPPLFFALAIFVGQSNALALMTALGLFGALTIWRGLRAYRVVRDSSDPETRRGAKDALTKGILVLTVITAVRSIANTGVSAWLPTYITFVDRKSVV